MELTGAKLLVIVAHPDDETIGCGGTLCRAHREGAQCRVLLPLRRADPRGSEQWTRLLEQFHSACNMLGAEPAITAEQIADLNAHTHIDAIHELILASVQWADIVLTHWHGDVHQAHRAVARAVEIATRPFRRRKVVAFFETATSTDQTFANTFSPNFFVALEYGDVERKQQAMDKYETEQAPGRNPRDLEIRARFRGSEIGLPYAEAFIWGRGFL